jgi:hypothetical protein
LEDPIALERVINSSLEEGIILIVVPSDIVAVYVEVR